MSAIATNKETTAVSTARRVLTAYEVAPLIGRGHNQVRELVRAGKLRALPGRNIKIPLESVNEFLATATREAK
jgi:excisionase family DNA binding protein